MIVWIDDHFLTPTFQEDKEKNAWNKLFGKINSSLYRLLDINIKFIRTAQEAETFINDEKIFKSHTYYYFIVDRKLPYTYGAEAVDTNSEEIIEDLKKYKKQHKSIDFSILSSGSPDSYAIKDIDYHLKPQNKEFTLPDELRHKILLNIKDNISFIDQYAFFQEKELHCFGNVDSKFSEELYLYPFIDKFRSFVELEEVDIKEFHTLIVLTKKSTSDRFIQQSLAISLYDFFKDYNGMNYYREKNYESFKKTGNYEELHELTDKIPVIRFDNFNIESYQQLYKFLKHKLVKVFVIDSDDDNISSYIDMTKKTKVIKIESLDSNPEASLKIVHGLIEKFTSEIDINFSNTIYANNNLLFLHPLLYRMLTDTAIHIPKLDDPSEIIFEVISYMENLGLRYLQEGEEIYENIKASKPFPLKSKALFERLKELVPDLKKYNLFLFNTIDFWLTNSWNVNYNVQISTYDTQAQWQEYSFTILKELLNEIDFNFLNDINTKDLQQIKSSIENFSLYMDTPEKLNNISIQLMWPHEKYPMYIYILNQIHTRGNKKLYIQNKDLNMVDDSIELENSFKNLEYKIDYHRSIFDLIKNTQEYMPSEINTFLVSISERIQDNKPIFYDELQNKILIEDRENFKKMANILLRIAINFGMLIVNTDVDKIRKKYKKNVLTPDKEDTAGIGKLLSALRDNIYSKIDIFTASTDQLRCSSYANSSEHLSFMFQYTKLLDNPSELKNSFIQTQHHKNMFKIGFENLIDIKDDKERSYQDRLFVNNNISPIAQLSNLSAYLSQNEHKFKIQKHQDAYSLFAYLTDTRNAWEHLDHKAWNREIFVEAFIYGYEAIWLMQKYILENVYNIKDLPNSYYVQLNNLEIITSEEENFKKDFKNVKAYDDYFSAIYNSKVKNK